MTTAQPDLHPEIIDIDAVATASVRSVVPMAEIRDFFDGSFGALGALLADQGIAPIGPPYGLYRGMPTDTVDVEVGFPVAEPIEPAGEVANGSLPAGRVVRAVHAGSFDGLGAAYGRLAEWMTGQGLTPSDSMWEVYLTEPSPDMDPADLRTEINWPVTG